MLNTRFTVAVVAGLILVLLAGFPAEALQPLPPHNFFGLVTVNGGPPPDGTRVRARIGGVICGETTTFTDGFGAGTYVGLAVVSSGQQLGCGDAGDTIRFLVEVAGLGFLRADQSATWESGGNTQLDLTVTIAVPPAPTPTPTPAPSPRAVGGYGEPLGAVELLAPWLGLVALLVLAAGVAWRRVAA